MPYSIPTAPTASWTPSRLRAELQDRLDTLATAHRVPGAQLVLDTGSDLIAVHTGVADAATGTPLTADTAVPLGSLTKPYTAALVMLLADDGDLDLDESAAGQLPELRDTPGVTIRHLLSHTGGLPTGPDSDTAAETTAARCLAAVCTARDLLFPPGTDFSYSNAGYVAAGRLAETVTGMPWHEAVSALLLEPLGTAPAFIGDHAPRRPVAAGHALNTATGRARPARQTLAPLEAPAGALLASALDLAAFGNALIGRSDVLPPAVTKEMRRPETAARPGALADGWGPGLALYRQDDRVWCGHDGNAQGTSCHLRADPESGIVVAFTGNSASATALWRDLTGELALLTGVRVPAAAQDTDPGRRVDLPECLGTYRNGTTTYRVAPGPDGTPALSVDGDLALPLVCYADLSCDLVDPATGRLEPGGRFHRDPATGRIDRVQISGRTARRTDDG
ncbi:class A beta-lactamase-related serine hydrolase [Streptomyces dangxiongensis]|uniref:Class A beta-lactamase-related serine hydrolase n=1 Tax=Streptomyces dangxiongensis TaxID=1442032 RepID=A0A3G2J739_9ACTN|nr:serine hydrolase domain-containing protein [Streptomyces dangxiongensis]AYN38050.1 class A beta-lactamase-related serine hydrolase [Streptomyces dangxiongensis]